MLWVDRACSGDLLLGFDGLMAVVRSDLAVVKAEKEPIDDVSYYYIVVVHISQLL